MKKVVYLASVLFLATLFLGFAKPQEVAAQTCIGTTPKCRTQEVRACTLPNGDSCLEGQLNCTCVWSCSGGTRWTCNACTGMSPCTTAKACEGIDNCICVEEGSGSCYLSATPPPTSTPGPTAPPGWGACDSCQCGHPGECQTDPTGACIWNPTTCGGGGGSSICTEMTVTYSPSNRTVYVGERLNANVTIKYTPPRVTYVRASVVSDPLPVPLSSRFVEFGWRDSHLDSYGTNINNPTTGEVQITLPVFGVRPGIQHIVIRGYSNTGPGNSNFCPDKSTNINVIEPIPDPWWQVTGGDAVSGAGSMRSFVPGGYQLILGNTAGYPGVAVYNGSINVGSRTVSSKRWSANTIYNDTQYNYEKFTELVPEDVTWNDVSRLHSGGVKTGDYEWFRVTGNYTLQPNLMINGGRKIILFVSNDLTINANVRLNDVKNDYFMAVAGQNISVANNVTNIAYGGGGSTLPTPIPPSGVPTNLTASCSNGTVSFSWNPVAGASYYPMRIYNTALGWQGCTKTDICPLVNAPTTSYSMAGTPGATYSWWMHSIIDGTWSEAVGGPNVTCSTASTLCGQACSLSTNCGPGLACVLSNRGAFCRNPLCPTDSNCICNDSVLGRASTTYALEGIFYADGAFNSGTGSNPLGVRGSVVANSITLGRNLGANNDDTPAETFEFGEENMLLYPKDLVGVTVAWKEVAP